VDDEVAGDRTFGNLDGGAGGAAEQDRRGDIADGGVGYLGVLWCKVGSMDVDLAAGQSCGRERRVVICLKASVAGCGGERN